MKHLLLCSAALAAYSLSASAESVQLTTSSGQKEYQINRSIERQIGPGTTYLRLRLPEYPLNVNVVMVDLTNPYNRIETTVAKESSRGTESLVTAAQRQSSVGHRPLAAANANFWIVASQPEEKVYSGITRNVSLRNGKMITESNQHRDQWDGGTMRTGIVGVSYDKTLSIDYCTSEIKISSDKIGTADVWQCNKGVWSDEICMYNSHYGADTQFMPITQGSDGKYILDTAGDATEVILDFAAGEDWRSGEAMKFVVKEVRTAAGKGTLGNHDLALVGRGDHAALLAALAEGDEVQLRYSWTFNPGSEQQTSPLIEQAVGGNALVMRNGELTEHNTNETYNSQVYSRTGYGCSADGKTLYMVVIDKSNDPVYGTSAGCATTQMCEIARHLGCANMANFDAGGSAELMVNNAIVNKTTEGTPRAVANGWMIYSIAPEDDSTVAQLAFFKPSITQPIYASSSPTIIAYDKYGAVISYDYKDVTFSCDESIGTCEGNVFTAGSNAATGTLTATVGDVSVSTEVTVVAAEVSLRTNNILIDNYREYPLEVVATDAGITYTYDPANLSWTVEDPSVVSIDVNGVLRGLNEGSTKITGQLGEFSTEAVVTVEIPTAQSIAFGDIAGWTVKGATGMSNITFDGTTGVAGYEYASPRTPYLEFSRTDGLTTFFALPESAYTDFTSDVNIEYITLYVKTPTLAREASIKIAPEGGFAPGTHHVEFDFSSAFDVNDIVNYPVTAKKIRFAIEHDTSNTGTHTFTFGGLNGVYPHANGIGCEAVVAAGTEMRLSANPVSAGSQFAVSAPALVKAEIFSTSGAAVSSATAVDDVAHLQAPAPGTYVVAATTETGRSASVLIVK